MSNLDKRLAGAVSYFWQDRDRQGGAATKSDYGERSSVVGGTQMNGFINLIRDVLVESGAHVGHLYQQKGIELPGYFRPEKKWDLLIVADGSLLAGMELKSQVGPSFGNNYNNRTEEALGNATDLWTAYREGAFKPSERPWLGYLFLLEETEGSTRPVRAREPHFKVFPEFRNASYARRYELLCERLVRERLYDSACFLVSPREGGRRGEYREPNAELSFERFVKSLAGRAISQSK